MPIRNHENGVDVCLGVGDIAICTSRFEGENADRVIDFYPHEPRPVGSTSTDEELEAIRARGGYSPVRIIFGNVEALDVLLERVQRCRDEMIEANRPTEGA